MLGKQGDLLGLSHLLAALDTRHQRLVEHALKILLQDIHVVAELGAGDSGIELGGLDIGMAEHLRYRSDRHAVFEGNGGGKGVAGDVDRAYLIKFFGRREPDVEWFRIEEIQKDRFREPQKRKAAGDCQPLCSE